LNLHFLVEVGGYTANGTDVYNYPVRFILFLLLLHFDDFACSRLANAVDHRDFWLPQRRPRDR